MKLHNYKEINNYSECFFKIPSEKCMLPTKHNMYFLTIDCYFLAIAHILIKYN